MQFPRLRILCIDADEDICSVLSFLLDQSDYEVRTAQSIDDALRLAGTEKFHLYLLAYKLKGGSGIELCRKLRVLDSRTPILFLSALVYDYNRQEALRAGANAFLRKPEGLSSLAETVNRLVSESHQAGAHIC